MDSAKVPEKVTTTSETQTFDFTDLSASVESGLKTVLAEAALSVDVIHDADAAKDFDYYIKPQLTARSVYDFWTYGCLMTYQLEVFDREQKLIASSSSEAKRNFLFTGQAEDKCNQAMSELFDAVNDKALSKLSR